MKEPFGLKFLNSFSIQYLNFQMMNSRLRNRIDLSLNTFQIDRKSSIYICVYT